VELLSAIPLPLLMGGLSIGFPLWALVVFWIGQKVISHMAEMRSEAGTLLSRLTERMAERDAKVDREMALMRATIERLDKLVERHDDILRPGRTSGP
jgi:Tfp pilus assembly protein PilN